MLRVDTIRFSQEDDSNILSVDQDPTQSTHRLSRTLFVFSPLDVVLWILPAHWNYRNVECWQSAETHDGRWRVFLVYRSWVARGGPGAPARSFIPPDPRRHP